MPSIHFNRFDLGIDLRKGRSVSDANRLLELRNAFVTTGMAAQKRPGLLKVGDFAPGTAGLLAAFGRLNTFSSQRTASGVPGVDCWLVPHPAWPATPQILDVPFADVFNGFIYCAARFTGGAVQHHYLDQPFVAPPATPHQTIVADANCPHTAACLKIGSKMYAVGSGMADVVRFSGTGTPRAWSTANDAGFLPTGINSIGAREAMALGMYRNNLAVLMRDGVQVWAVGANPAAMRLLDVVENIGTIYPNTVVNVGGDLYFLSDYGFRSMTTLQLTSSLADVDIGSPVDSLVREALAAPGADAVNPKAVYFYGTGQYVCAIRNHLFVYSISRTARIAAWSHYVLPAAIADFAELGRDLFVRCRRVEGGTVTADVLYRLDEAASADDDLTIVDPYQYRPVANPYEVLIQLPYLDLRGPGVLKQLYGADVVVDGTCLLSVGFDVRDPLAFTPEVRLDGDTRPGGMIPVECIGTEFSVRLRNLDNRPFRLDAITLHFNNLGH